MNVLKSKYTDAMIKVDDTGVPDITLFSDDDPIEFGRIDLNIVGSFWFDFHGGVLYLQCSIDKDFIAKGESDGDHEREHITD